MNTYIESLDDKDKAKLVFRDSTNFIDLAMETLY